MVSFTSVTQCNRTKSPRRFFQKTGTMPTIRGDFRRRSVAVKCPLLTRSGPAWPKFVVMHNTAIIQRCDSVWTFTWGPRAAWAMATVIETATSIRIWRPSRSLHRLAPYLYVLPALAALALWNYYPLLFLVDLSFHRLDASSPLPSWAGLANYRELFTDPLFWRVLRNTAIYTF